MLAAGLLSMLTLSALATAGDISPATLTVMSFNVRYGTANDGDNSWPNRRDILIRTIRSYAPDVFGTQECVEFQADYLRETLKEYRIFGAGRDADGGGEGMTVLYNPKTLVPLETGNFWLSETPNVPGSQSWGSSCPRMVTWARFFHREARKPFLYLNTHFDHVSAEARKHAAELLLQRANEMADDDPIIITGDFNARGGDSEPWQILTEGGFMDSWLTATEREGPQQTYSGFNPPDMHSNNRIDWILYEGAAPPLRCETVTTNEDGQYPSDHFPVVAKFVLREK